jgi:hypothetical protein
MVENQQMIAYRVIAIDVSSREKPPRIGDGGAFFIENMVTQLLRLTDFGGSLRQPDFQRANAAETLRRPVCAGRPSL